MATPAIRLQTHRFTVDEYARLGPILPNVQTELIEGMVTELPPIGVAHFVVVTRLTAELADLVRESRLLVQQPIQLNQFSEPQPDLVVLHHPIVATRKVQADDCRLVIEVADSTYEHDRAVKVPMYLDAGVPEVWLVNISDHANPSVEVWIKGVKRPGVAARGGVHVSGCEVWLPRVFEGLEASPGG